MLILLKLTKTTDMHKNITSEREVLIHSGTMGHVTRSLTSTHYYNPNGKHVKSAVGHLPKGYTWED